MIQNLYLFKNGRKEKDNQPDYVLQAKIGEEFTEVGAAFLKDGKNGKFFSIALKKPYKDKKGYYLETYKEGDISE